MAHDHHYHHHHYLEKKGSRRRRIHSSSTFNHSIQPHILDKLVDHNDANDDDVEKIFIDNDDSLLSAFFFSSLHLYTIALKEKIPFF